MKPPTKRQIQESEEERIKMLLKATEKKETNPIDEIDVDKEFVNEKWKKFWKSWRGVGKANHELRISIRWEYYYVKCKVRLMKRGHKGYDWIGI